MLVTATWCVLCAALLLLPFYSTIYADNVENFALATLLQCSFYKWYWTSKDVCFVLPYRKMWRITLTASRAPNANCWPSRGFLPPWGYPRDILLWEWNFMYAQLLVMSAFLLQAAGHWFWLTACRTLLQRGEGRPLVNMLHDLTFPVYYGRSVKVKS